jgi:hypothetical protein
MTTNGPRRIRIDEGDTEHSFGMQYPSLVAQKDLPSDIKEWPIPKPSPLMLSMFDEMLNVYAYNAPCVTGDPTSCTVAFRRIMLSMWIGFLNRVRKTLGATHKQLREGSGGYGSNYAYKWQQWLFSDLVYLKVDVEYFLIFLLRNMKALEIKLCDINGRGGHGIVTPWEMEEWKFVEIKLLSIKQSVNSMAESYVQAVSLQESQYSNAQARSVGRLTALATVFVPVSIIAAIFSMGGSFAAGERRFWVFFVITIPIILIISTLLFTNVFITTQEYVKEHLLSARDAIRGTHQHVHDHRLGRVGKEGSLPLFHTKQC